MLSETHRKKTMNRQSAFFEARNDVNHNDVISAEDAEEQRTRRTILIKKTPSQSWGFTLQSYGILHRDTDAVQLITFVDYVELDGAACIGGLRKGDVILSINGVSVEALDHALIVETILKSETSIRMVVLFDNCCKKIDLYLRHLQLKRILAEKMFELKSLEKQEERIKQGKGAFLSRQASIKSSLSIPESEAGLVNAQSSPYATTQYDAVSRSPSSSSDANDVDDAYSSLLAQQAILSPEVGLLVDEEGVLHFKNIYNGVDDEVVTDYTDEDGEDDVQVDVDDIRKPVFNIGDEQSVKNRGHKGHLNDNKSSQGQTRSRKLNDSKSIFDDLANEILSYAEGKPLGTDSKIIPSRQIKPVENTLKTYIGEKENSKHVGNVKLSDKNPVQDYENPLDLKVKIDLLNTRKRSEHDLANRYRESRLFPSSVANIHVNTNIESDDTQIIENKRTLNEARHIDDRNVIENKRTLNDARQKDDGNIENKRNFNDIRNGDILINNKRSIKETRRIIRSKSFEGDAKIRSEVHFEITPGNTTSGSHLNDHYVTSGLPYKTTDTSVANGTFPVVRARSRSLKDLPGSMDPLSRLDDVIKTRHGYSDKSSHSNDVIRNATTPESNHVFARTGFGDVMNTSRAPQPMIPSLKSKLELDAMRSRWGLGPQRQPSFGFAAENRPTLSCYSPKNSSKTQRRSSRGKQQRESYKLPSTGERTSRGHSSRTDDAFQRHQTRSRSVETKRAQSTSDLPTSPVPHRRNATWTSLPSDDRRRHRQVRSSAGLLNPGEVRVGRPPASPTFTRSPCAHEPVTLRLKPQLLRSQTFNDFPSFAPLKRPQSLFDPWASTRTNTDLFDLTKFPIQFPHSLHNMHNMHNNMHNSLWLPHFNPVPRPTSVSDLSLDGASSNLSAQSSNAFPLNPIPGTSPGRRSCPKILVESPRMSMKQYRIPNDPRHQNRSSMNDRFRTRCYYKDDEMVTRL